MLSNTTTMKILTAAYLTQYNYRISLTLKIAAVDNNNKTQVEDIGIKEKIQNLYQPKYTFSLVPIQSIENHIWKKY